MRKLLLGLLLALACCGMASAQGTAYRIGPYPSDALVYVCPYPDGGTPCPSPSTIYVNPALTIQQPNPFVLRGGSNFTFYLSSGQYTVQVPSLGRNDILGIGLTPNISNTFTAPQNFDADIKFKGPNPWADVSRFGGYFGPATPVTTTANCTSGSPTATLGSAQDFVNGNGILLLNCGAAPTIATPSGLTVAPGGVTGSTTYNYVVVREDYFGGRTASSASAASTTSVATLGLQTVALSGCNRASGIVTCTTTGNHNFQAGYQANIFGTNSPKFEGAVTIVTVPTATTFTYSQYGFDDSTGVLTSGSVQVFATNRLKWNSDSTNTVLKSYIYRCTASCGVVGPNYVLAGVSVGVDGYFEDRGYSISPSVVGVGDVPATAPTTASNQYLATTITAGGGTTSLTLAANATNTVAGATVLHDNSPNVILACNSFNTKGGTVYVPNSNSAANYFPIYSNLDLHGCPAQTQLLFANKVWQNATIINASYTNLKGAPSGTNGATVPFNQYRPVTGVFGFAYPFVYASPAASTGNHSYDDLGFFCNQSYQPCLYQDQFTTSGSITSVRYENLHLASNNGRTTPLVIKGGFNFFFSNGGWSNAPGGFGGMPAALFSMNCGLTNSSQQLAYLVNTQYTYVFGGIVFEKCNNGSGVNDQIDLYSFRDTLIESSYVPFIRLSNQGAAGAGAPYIADSELVRTIYADQVSGQSNPLVDASFGSIHSLRIQSPSCPFTGMAVSVGPSTGAVQSLDVTDDGCGGTPATVGSPSYVLRGTYGVNAEVYAGVPLVATGTGAILYQMATPLPLQSAVVGAGGSVPVGAHTYGVEAFDYSGRGTIVSPTITATTTGGNQTVALTLPASFPAGAQGVKLMRDNVVLSNALLTVPGAVVNDSAASAFGSSPNSFTTAGQNSIDVNGITASSLRLACASGYTAPFTGAFGCDSSTSGLYHGNIATVDNIFGLAPASLSVSAGDVVTWSSQGQFGTSTPGGGGTTFLKVTGLGTAANGDILRQNNSGVWATATPGVPGRVVTNSGTLSGADLVVCTAGTGDRGSTIIFTNAAAVTETLPNPAAGACSNNFNVRLYWQGAAGGTLKATTATVNGIAGATGIVIPGNTWVDAISHDNVNYDVYIARGIKCGTNLTEVLNADMTVTCNASAGGSPTWDAITSAAGNLSLSNANFTSTFNHTSSVAWMWANTTAATVTVPQPAPSFTWSSQYWATGAVTGTDTWKVVPTLVAGLNGSSILDFTHTGSTFASPAVRAPYLIASNSVTGFTLVATATTGSAPLTITSTTAVANLTVQRINPLFVGGVAVVGAGVSAERYNTAATSQTAAIGSTTMVTAPAADTNYEFSAYVGQLNAGTGCAGAGSVGVNIIFTDPVTGTSYTFVLDTQTSGAVALTTTVPLTNGGLTVSNVGDFKYMFRAKASTTVNYSTTYTAGASCSTGQAYNIYPVLLER